MMHIKQTPYTHIQTQTPRHTQGSQAELHHVQGQLTHLHTALQRVVLQRWLVGLVSKLLDYGGMLLNYGCIAYVVLCTGMCACGVHTWWYGVWS